MDKENKDEDEMQIMDMRGGKGEVVRKNDSEENRS